MTLQLEQLPAGFNPNVLGLSDAGLAAEQAKAAELAANLYEERGAIYERLRALQQEWGELQGELAHVNTEITETHRVETYLDRVVRPARATHVSTGLTQQLPQLKEQKVGALALETPPVNGHASVNAPKHGSREFPPVRPTFDPRYTEFVTDAAEVAREVANLQRQVAGLELNAVDAGECGNGELRAGFRERANNIRERIAGIKQSRGFLREKLPEPQVLERISAGLGKKPASEKPASEPIDEARTNEENDAGTDGAAPEKRSWRKGWRKSGEKSGL